MTLEEIKARVDAIAKLTHDDEQAHCKEDSLRGDFLEWLAQTASDDIAERARLILTTDDMDFARWYA
jgi:hypothetical protein